MSTSLRKLVFAATLISTAVAGSVGAAQAASDAWRSHGMGNRQMHAELRGSNNDHFRGHRNFHDWGHYWPAPAVMYYGLGSGCEALALRLGREGLPYGQERAILANHGC